MNCKIRNMEWQDWNEVSKIYKEGIESGRATFEVKVPDYLSWNNGHLEICRFVAVDLNNKVIGWIALSPTSNRVVYRGVAEVSIYISNEYTKRNIGFDLLEKLVEESERNGIWTLESSIFEINEASIRLHEKCGFRKVGFREKLGCDKNGVWQNTVLMEKRKSS